MAVAEDGFDDIRREEAEPRDSGEVGSTDARLVGMFGDLRRDRISANVRLSGLFLFQPF